MIRCKEHGGDTQLNLLFYRDLLIEMHWAAEATLDMPIDSNLAFIVIAS